MTLSLGEVEAMARKAARGAGYDWGIADEAGYAVRWLEARKVGGIIALAEVLDVVANAEPSGFAPKGMIDWTCPQNQLCPVMTGLVLADGAMLRGSGVINLPSVMAPLLLLPFVGHLSASQGHALSVVAGTGSAIVLGENINVTGDWRTYDGPVEIKPRDARPPPGAKITRVNPDPSAWKTLKRMASRTYAPATEASRLMGAGAGLTDND